MIRHVLLFCSATMIVGCSDSTPKDGGVPGQARKMKLVEVQKSLKSKDPDARVQAIHATAGLFEAHPREIMEILATAVHDKNVKVANATCSVVLKIGEPALESLPSSHKVYLKKRNCARCHGG